MGSAAGVSWEKIGALENFEQTDLFTPAEKAALHFAEALCERTVDVPDAVFDELQRHFSEAEMVDIAAMAAVENFRARFNRAFDVPSDNLCLIPSHVRTEKPVMAK